MSKKFIALMALFLSMGFFAPLAMAFDKDSLTWEKCTGCHEPEGGKIPRVEDIRTTPEEWWVIVDRMARLYDMELAEGEMDILLKELSNTQILTPEEMRKVSYLNMQHNSQQMESPANADEMELTAVCVRCHSAGKIYSYRMTPDHWAKLKDLHLYIVPTVTMQQREMRWLPRAEAVLETLSKKLDYGKTWKAPKGGIAGNYLVLGREPGKGEYRGEAKIKELDSDELSLAGTLEYADGTSENFSGKATVYGGYALRIKSKHNGVETKGAYIFENGILDGENHFPAPRFKTSSSRWFPMDGKASILRVTPGYLLHGDVTTMTIEGLNLPMVSASDLKFNNPAVKVLSAERISENAIQARVIYQGFEEGETVLKVKNLSTENLLAENYLSNDQYAAGAVAKFVPGTIRLAHEIERIDVTPNVGRSRLEGGLTYPAEGVQFEAVAYSGGASIADTSDDIFLGPVHARFHLEEEVTRPDDDDLKWAGEIAKNGLYIPTGDYNPIPTRKYSNDASAWVKVVAEYEAGEKLLIGEANLANTPPDFIKRVR